MKAEKTIKSIIMLFAVVITTINSMAQEIIYEKADSIFIEEIICKHATEQATDIGNRITALAQEFIGREYFAGTLDKYDNEPLYINSYKVDCTTFVELTLAIATSKGDCLADVCRNLELIRYRNGKNNGYTSRLHYISWWISDPAKRSIIKEIETNKHTAEQKQNLNFMSYHPESYSLLKGNRQRTEEIAKFEKESNNVSIKYIPKENIGQMTDDEIKEGDIIAIVTAIEGLDVSHVGFAHWHGDTLHMIHASSTAGKVIDDPTSLADYLARRKSHLGIRIFRAL